VRTWSDIALKLMYAADGSAGFEAGLPARTSASAADCAARIVPAVRCSVCTMCVLIITSARICSCRYFAP
jgi:hypothetical protein